MNNEALMRSARESLTGKWGTAILTFFLYMVITGIGGLPGVAGVFVSILIAGPLGLGIAMFSLNIVRNKEIKVEQMFDGFKNFITAFLAYLMMCVFIFLWTLLLIVPGIIAALAYSMTFFIMADNPTISAVDALSASKKMMNGYKMKLFVLYLVFLLLAILCILTLFIGFLWLMPFMNVTLAKFYEEIKDNPVVELRA